MNKLGHPTTLCSDGTKQGLALVSLAHEQKRGSFHPLGKRIRFFQIKRISEDFQNDSH